MDPAKLLSYARLILRVRGTISPHRTRVYVDDVISVEESQRGVFVRGWTIPRGRLLLNWNRWTGDFGTFKETDEWLPGEEEHIQKLVVLELLAKEAQ